MATKDEKPKDIESIFWNCSCLKCGRKNVIVRGDYLRNGDTKSCGCLNSKNESFISQMLDTLQFKYKTQYSFLDLTSTGRSCDKLLFDFAIFNRDTNELLYLIEYDGIQHFNPKHARSKEGYFKTIQNDNLKN